MKRNPKPLLIQFKKTTLVLCLFLFQFFLTTIEITGQNIPSHQWERRVLIIQSSHKDHPLLSKQRQEFINSKQEFADRKLIVYEVVGSKYKSFDYLLSLETPWKQVSSDYINMVPQKHPFIVLLLGLDGSVKMKQYDSMLSKENLLNTIDAMPMRIRELQKQKP